ncbi:hypothetical protein [Bradyrhizobium icense]|uniref:DUF968 domain-containing protein n=1 Tax=Bradyrhizobium icense TaxID=1274631 RepID=UPI0012EAEEEF|nr:hypothetical protein [Bradyrhizobium icense]
MSKLSAAELRYWDMLGTWLRDDWRPCPIYPNERAAERSHPRGVAEWGTGTGMKAHHFFAVGLSKRAHLEYDADHDGFERRHGVRHAQLIKNQWASLGVSPGPWMYEGMSPKRAEWLKRVLDKIF